MTKETGRNTIHAVRTREKAVETLRTLIFSHPLRPSGPSVRADRSGGLRVLRNTAQPQDVRGGGEHGEAGEGEDRRGADI
eukprot:141221-Hanusia_phi.AAC.1